MFLDIMAIIGIMALIAALCWLVFDYEKLRSNFTWLEDLVLGEYSDWLLELDMRVGKLEPKKGDTDETKV